MGEKVHKARYVYTCDYCYEKIPKGCMYVSYKTRYPRFDDKEKQIGIQYVTSKVHHDYIACNYKALEKGLIDALPWQIINTSEES